MYSYAYLTLLVVDGLGSKACKATAASANSVNMTDYEQQAYICNPTVVLGTLDRHNGGRFADRINLSRVVVRWFIH